jgi:hypothetical protein
MGVGAWTAPGGAQEAAPQQEARALRVYLDCSGRRRGICNLDLYRQEITFVNWVREPQDAQALVILTSQDTGGGTRYTLDFLGQDGLDGMEDRLTYDALVTDVEDETAQGLVQTLRLGLVRYITAAGLAQGIDVAVAGEQAA